MFHYIAEKSVNPTSYSGAKPPRESESDSNVDMLRILSRSIRQRGFVWLFAYFPEVKYASCEATENRDDKRNHVFSLYEVGRRDKRRALFDICMSDRSMVASFTHSVIKGSSFSTRDSLVTLKPDISSLFDLQRLDILS